LYDLKNDPVELDNLIEDKSLRDVREELDLGPIHWLVKIQDQLPLDRYRMKRVPSNHIKEE